MKIETKIRKPIAKIKEGYVPDYIIGWYKTDWFVINNEVVQWKYWLEVDLWLVKFRLTWLYPFKVLA